MKLKLFAKIKEESGNFYAPIILGKGRSTRTVDLALPPTWDLNSTEPIDVSSDLVNPGDGRIMYLYKRRLIDIEGNNVPKEELIMRVKHFVLKNDRELGRIAKQVEAFENMSKTVDARREQIPESVRMFVWQRDQGKCVKCSSSEKLEFDHIIPVIKGGANTERNIQLLCESCNRSKGKDV